MKNNYMAGGYDAKEKALVGGTTKGLQNHSNHKQADKRYFHYTGNMGQKQCKKCGSDYMRFSTSDGICIRCQQFCEHLIRSGKAVAKFKEATL